MVEYIYMLMYACAYIIEILVIISTILPDANIFFQLAMLKSGQKIHYSKEYFRDILSYSPSEIYYIYNKNFKYKWKDYIFLIRKFRKLFLINLLKMELLGYIDIDFTNRKNFKISKKDVVILDKEYQHLNNFIFNHITYNNEITLYEIYDFIKKNGSDEYFKKWEEIIQEKIQKRGFYYGNFYGSYKDKIKTYYIIALAIMIVMITFFLIVDYRTAAALLIVLPLFITHEYKETKRIKVISPEGIQEYRKMIALKNFLKDFSIIDERDPAYSQILEDYVLYANIFDMIKNKIKTENTINEIKYVLSKIQNKEN